MSRTAAAPAADPAADDAHPRAYLPPGTPIHQHLIGQNEYYGRWIAVQPGHTTPQCGGDRCYRGMYFSVEQMAVLCERLGLAMPPDLRHDLFGERSGYLRTWAEVAGLFHDRFGDSDWDAALRRR
jgi:hypothetical protein